MAIVLQACAALAPRHAEPLAVAVPPNWSGTAGKGATGATSLTQWWLRFNDPQLGELITQALQANTTVNTAQAKLRQARALRDVAAAALWPGLGGSASVQRSKTGQNDPVNRVATGLDASWELDLFGVNRNALGASEGSVRVSGATLGDVRVSIAAETAFAYITLRSAQRRLELARDNLASQEETLQITQWRRDAGLVTALEADQARAAAAQTRAQLPALETNIAQSRHAIAVLTGQAPAALDAALVAVRPVPQAGDELALEIPAETLRQRPDVRAAELQVGVELSRLSQADAARLPNFKLSGSLGLNALTFGLLGNPAALAASVLAGVTLPIFDGGALRGRVRAQEAVLEQSGIAYRAAVLTALKDVEDALIALRGDRLRLDSLRIAADAAATAYLLARQRFGSGLVDYQVVLETQRTQFGTQDSVAGANADVSADQVRLIKALGGGWRSGDESVAAAVVPLAALPSPAAVTRTSPP